MKLYASSNRHDYTGYRLIINLTGSMHMSYDKPTGEFGAAKLCPTFLSQTSGVPVPEPPQLIIPWQDGGVPDFTKALWLDLFHDLQHIQGRVLVHCHGGHGRTGTMLAILLALSGALKKDPVLWLRKNYCEKAVETRTQIDYIRSLGIETTCGPSRMPIGLIQHHWTPHNWLQEEYNLTKPATKSQPTEPTQLEPLYQCILCRRKQRGIDFYQTFLDMTGFCWSCHQLKETTNPDTLQA